MGDFIPLAVSTRGSARCNETLHTGSLAIIDGTGQVLTHRGDPTQRFPLRSTIKFVQLLPLLIDGLDEKFDLDDADLAVMMSSHNGELLHTRRISNLLERFGLQQSQLRCGTHPPELESTRFQLLQDGLAPCALHCNCSGKHTGMLAVCAANDWPTDTYLQEDHPLQQRILSLIRKFAGIPESQHLDWSIDGCSLPTYSLSLLELATTFAKIADPAKELQIEQSPDFHLLAKIRRAAAKHPEMIAGSGRLDTRLMGQFGKQLFSKSGADGMYAMALNPTVAHPQGLGIAFKVADGDPTNRIRELIATYVLAQLEPDVFAGIEDFMDTRRLNNAGIQVGDMETVFSI